MIDKEKIEKQLLAEGIVPIRVRLQVLVDKMNSDWIDEKERLEISELLSDILHRSPSSWKMKKWFKDLVRLSEDWLNEAKR